MKKLSMISQVSITFEQGCDRYILNCQQRNLRQGTMRYSWYYYIFGITFVNYLVLCVHLLTKR